MDHNTLQALTALANKLGTTADQLWAVLLAQAPIDAAISVVQALICIGVTAGWLLLVYRKTRMHEVAGSSGRYTYADTEWTGEAAFFAWVAGFVLLVFSLVTASYAIRQATVAVLNPNYWALTQVLKALN